MRSEKINNIVVDRISSQFEETANYYEFLISTKRRHMITIIPAYHRDYKTRLEVIEDWNTNRDFIVYDRYHPYHRNPINKLDAKRDKHIHSVLIKYDLTRKTIRIEV